MDIKNNLERISTTIVQKIYQCLFQAVGEDYQEAEAKLDLETHVSKPFIVWDLIYRNLIRNFSDSSDSNVLYATQKRGMWEVMLLFDKESKMLFSFMRDIRFKSIRKVKRWKQPEYIRALLTLNENLQAENKQQCFFGDNTQQDNLQLKNTLNSLCENFSEPIVSDIDHHVLVVFSSNYGQITSLKAMVLDSDLDIVTEQDWLDISKPMISNEVLTVEKKDSQKKLPALKEKAIKRKKQKELVVLKIDESASEDEA